MYLDDVSKNSCKEFVAKGLRIRDNAINSGNQCTLDLVTMRLSVEDSCYRRDMRLFASGTYYDVSPDTIVVCRNYCLGKVHCRRTEGQHATIKCNLKKKTWMIPELLNLQLKGLELDRRLTDPQFYAFAIANYRRRDLARRQKSF